MGVRCHRDWRGLTITAHRFPYREEGNPPKLRPTVDIQLRFGANGEWTTRALIDTGSPITLFDRGAADALLIKIGRLGAERGEIALLGGRRQVQFEHVELCLAADPTAFCWVAHVGFITDPMFQMVFQGILGSDGFLDRWAVTFNKYYDYFAIQHPDDAPG